MMTNYPKCAHSFIKLCTSNKKFFNEFVKLGNIRPFDVSLRDGIQSLNVSEQEQFTTKIKNFGDFYVTGGLSWERNAKMLSLGVGDTEDYVNFVSEYMTLNNVEENKLLLESLFNKLKKEDLVELVNQIKI